MRQKATRAERYVSSMELSFTCVDRLPVGCIRPCRSALVSMELVEAVKAVLHSFL